jgi:hypothetical protein
MAMGVDSRGKHHRKSLNTCDLDVAAKRVRNIELDRPKTPDAIFLDDAYHQYTTILRSQRDVKQNSIDNNYDIVWHKLQPLGKPMLGDITGAMLDKLVGMDRAWCQYPAQLHPHHATFLWCEAPGNVLLEQGGGNLKKKPSVVNVSQVVTAARRRLRTQSPRPSRARRNSRHEVRYAAAGARLAFFSMDGWRAERPK